MSHPFNSFRVARRAVRAWARTIVLSGTALCATGPWSPVALADDLFWANPLGGAFDQGANWQGGVVPGAGDSVNFPLDAPTAAPSPYTVTLSGDISTQTLLSIRSGSTGVASLTIDLQGHDWALAPSTLSPFGLVAGFPDLNAEMTLTGGGTVTSAAPVLAGYLSLTAGTVLTSDHGFAAGRLTVRGPGSRWSMTGDLSIGIDQSYAGTVQILDGGRIDAAGISMFRGAGGSSALLSAPFSSVNVDGAGSILNVGTMNVEGPAGGFLGGGVILSNNGRLNATVLNISQINGVSVRGGILNVHALTSATGTVDFQSGVLQLNDFALGNLATFGQSMTLGANRSIAVSGNTALQAGSSLTIDGGTFKTGALSGDGTFNFVTGTFELGAQDLAVTEGGLLGKFLSLPTARTLVLGQNLVVSSDAQFATSGGGRLIAGGIVNEGQIIVDGFISDVQAGSLTNRGLVIGDGRLGARLINEAGGQVRVGTGQLMQFAGNADSSNDAALNILGGTLEVAHDLDNNATGVIAGRGTLIVGDTLVNRGRVNISGGTTDIIGDVHNLDDGTIIVSGGSILTFFDDVINNGSEIRVSAGSSAVYFGAVSGAGRYTGSGLNFFEGTFSPGNSPALVEVQGDVTFGDNNTLVIELAGTTPGTEYDRLQVGNEVTLGGTLRFDLLDGFIPAAGDVYTFLIAGGGLFGDFSSIVLPALSGLSFNIDRDATSLSLAVSATPIPLPAGIWLLGSALCACFGLRRRRALI